MRRVLQTVLFITLISSGLPSCLDNPYIGQWVQFKNEIPPGSVIGGYQDIKSTDLYICRVGSIVGKYYKPNKHCYIQLKDGKELSYAVFEMLTNVGHIIWVPVKNKQMPCNLIQTGGTNIFTYTGRNFHKKFLIPGNVIDGTLYLPFGNVSNQHYNEFQALSAVPRALEIEPSRRSSIYWIDSRYLTFKVESSYEVVIDFGVGSEMIYSLYIGSFENRISGIGPIGTISSYEKTENILHPSNLKGFWVRWIEGNEIQFGSNGNMEPLVKYNHKNVSKINTVQFRSSLGKSNWQIGDLRVLI